jgi:two-component system NtrC family response regulator
MAQFSDSPPSATKPKLLVVDDDENIRTQMKWALAQDYSVSLAEDRLSALAVLRKEQPVVVTLDLGLPPKPGTPEEGLLVLSEMLGQSPFLKVIIITGQGEKDNALQAIGHGAYDFLCKPIEVEELRGILRRAFYVAQLEHEHHALQLRTVREDFEGMVGSSTAMQGVFTTIRKVATSEVPVLITGESGTGKELAARALHRLSDRKEGPFVAINCGAIPENLLESELFGHEKGAFTGAHIQRRGRIESAQGGVLFLDEIGEMSPTLQVKFLRFLQERVIERVGGRVEIPVDVRVIAATNVDLKKAMKEGRFREDLYFRLGVVLVAIPPLREREGDIGLLANLFLQRYAEEHRKKFPNLSRATLLALEHYSWPGNVRELENRIKRAVIMAEGGQITTQDLEIPEATGEKPVGKRLREAREEIERELVQQAISRNKGNMTQAAAELGISRPTLYELMEKLGIERSAFNQQLSAVK